METNIQEYWVTNIKDEVKFRKLTFPVDTSFEKTLFVATPNIGEDLKKNRNHMEDPSITGLVASYTSLLKHATIYNTITFVPMDI